MIAHTSPTRAEGLRAYKPQGIVRTAQHSIYGGEVNLVLSFVKSLDHTNPAHRAIRFADVHKGIRAEAATHHVALRTANQDIITRPARQRVSPVAARQTIGHIAARQRVGIGSADQIFKADEPKTVALIFKAGFMGGKIGCDA